MNIKEISKKTRIIAVLLTLVVFSIVGFVFFYQELRKRSKAAPTGTPEIYLSTVDDPPMQTDGGLKVALKLNPNGVTTDLYAFDVEVKFDAAKVEMKNKAGVEANVFLATDILKQQVILVGTDTIRIVGTRIGSPFSATNQKIADITFMMKSTDGFPVSFNLEKVTLEVSNFVKVPLTLTSNTAPGSSSSSSSSGDRVSLSFASKKTNYAIGETVSIDVVTSTGSKEIGSVGVSFSFDASRLVYVSTVVDTNFFNKTSITPHPKGNTVDISVARSTAISGNIKIATVNFTVTESGQADFSYNQGSCVVYTFAVSPQNILTDVNPYSVTLGSGSSSSSETSSSSSPPGDPFESNGDILNINSAVFDLTPLRYEQSIILDKGEYILSGGALVYTARGKGVFIALACGESNCGDGKILNNVIGQTPLFPVSTSFQRQEATVRISDAGDKKKYTVRIYVDSGSEADFDFVSLTDLWGGEKLENTHFALGTHTASPRKYPEIWEMDMAGIIYGTIDTNKGTNGSLFINSSSRK